MLLLMIPLLCAFSSSGSFPKPFSIAEEQKYIQKLKSGSEEEEENSGFGSRLFFRERKVGTSLSVP